MISLTLITISRLINYLVFIECTSEDLSLNKGQSFSDDDNQPSFSFDRITFSNFKFNVNEETIKKETMGASNKLCNPLNNFIWSLCMFYSYSKLINDSEFSKIFDEFIEEYHKKNSGLCEENNVSLDDYSLKQEALYNTILHEKDPCKQLVTVEEKDGRMIFKQNNLYNPPINEKDVYKNAIPECESKKMTVDFLLKFNELYLQGFFGTDVFNSLKNLNESYSEKASNSTFTITDYFDAKLFDLYLKLYQDVLDNNMGLKDESVEYCKNFCKQLLGNSFLKYTSRIVKKDISNLIPKRLADSITKVTAKVFFHVSDNLELFSFHSAEYVGSIYPLKDYLKKNFEEKNLSAKTIEILVTFCLESYI